MGGYALYVWSSYGFVLAMLAALIFASFRGLRARESALAALEERFGPRRQRRREQDTEMRHGT